MTKETKSVDINDDDFFVKGVKSNKFFQTTNNYKDNDSNKIYTGGYSDISKELLEKYKVKALSQEGEKILLTASVDLDNLENLKSIKIDGKVVLVSDIVAKSAIPYPTTIKRRFINAMQTDPIINTIFTIIT